jgi:hypothetical protein
MITPKRMFLLALNASVFLIAFMPAVFAQTQAARSKPVLLDQVHEDPAEPAQTDHTLWRAKRSRSCLAGQDLLPR